MLRAGSALGDVFFGGKEEFVVYRYLPIGGSSVNGGTVLSIQVFALHSDTVAASNSRGPRHLREIENIRCSVDGCHAVIQCSDGAIYLYSTTDILGTGAKPMTSKLCDSVSHIAPQLAGVENRAFGFLSYLFRASSQFNIETSICTSGVNELTICIAWQSHMQPQLGGVLHCQRLQIQSGSSMRQISLPGKMFDDFTDSIHYCTVCGSSNGNHWEQEATRFSPAVKLVEPSTSSATKSVSRCVDVQYNNTYVLTPLNKFTYKVMELLMTRKKRGAQKKRYR